MACSGAFDEIPKNVFFLCEEVLIYDAPNHAKITISTKGPDQWQGLDGMVEVLVSVEFTAKLWRLRHIPGYRMS